MSISEQLIEYGFLTNDNIVFSRDFDENKVDRRCEVVVDIDKLSLRIFCDVNSDDLYYGVDFINESSLLEEISEIYNFETQLVGIHLKDGVFVTEMGNII